MKTPIPVGVDVLIDPRADDSRPYGYGAKPALARKKPRRIL